MWSKLIGSSTWNKAYLEYSNPSRLYHNISHIIRLYELAEELNLAYDSDLDEAILRHDVIYDELPEKEIRSANWLDNTAWEANDTTKKLILSTVDHTPCDDNRLIILDLFDLMSKIKRSYNVELIRLESKALYGVTDKKFYSLNSEFMLKLSIRIRNNEQNYNSVLEKHVFEKIVDGIENLIKENNDKIILHGS